jgi:ribosomal protein L12E/L44/L45/RPP1/RPP2
VTGGTFNPDGLTLAEVLSTATPAPAAAPAAVAAAATAAAPAVAAPLPVAVDATLHGERPAELHHVDHHFHHLWG